MDHIKKVIKEKLSRFNNDEKNDVITMLILVGIKHYSLLYPDELIHSTSLKFLCDKYSHEFLLDPNESRKKQYLHRLALEDAKSKQHQYIHNDHGRNFRPDFMAHYPFIDAYGTVEDALNGNYRESLEGFPEINLMNMGIPGQNRFIVKIFHEMRLDRPGIRISDLPEALYRLGIIISPALRHILEKARGKEVDGPLIKPHQQLGQAGQPSIYYDDGTIPPEYEWYYLEKHIPLGLFKVIVRNFLKLRHQGIEPRTLAQVLPPMGNQQQQTAAYADNNGGDDDGDEFDEFQREEGGYEDDDESAGQQQHQQPQPTVSYSSSSHRGGGGGGRGEEESKQHSGSSSNRPRSSSRPRSAPPAQQRRQPQTATAADTTGNLGQTLSTREYYRRVKAVPSRIAHYIDRDKRQHAITRHHTESAIKQSLAHQRVEEHLTNTYPSRLGIRDPIYTTTGTGPSRQTTTIAAKRPEYQRKRRHDLSSGTATMEIASAFLTSSVGRELTSSTSGASNHRLLAEMELDEQLEDVTPFQASQQAIEMLGEVQGQLHGNVLGSHRMVSNRVNKSGNIVPRTLQDRYHQQQLEQEMKTAMTGGATGSGGRGGGGGGGTGSSWVTKEKTRQGEWVGDFGPIYKQNAYTGPEKYRHALQKKVDERINDLATDHGGGGGGGVAAAGEDGDEDGDDGEVIQDEMLMQFAKDIISTRDRPMPEEEGDGYGGRGGAGEVKGYGDNDIDQFNKEDAYGLTARGTATTTTTGSNSRTSASHSNHNRSTLTTTNTSTITRGYFQEGATAGSGQASAVGTGSALSPTTMRQQQQQKSVDLGATLKGDLRQALAQSSSATTISPRPLRAGAGSTTSRTSVSASSTGGHNSTRSSRESVTMMSRDITPPLVHPYVPHHYHTTTTTTARSNNNFSITMDSNSSESVDAAVLGAGDDSSDDQPQGGGNGGGGRGGEYDLSNNYERVEDEMLRRLQQSVSLKGLVQAASTGSGSPRAVKSKQ